ncbi:MBL fold metallo-hydrolase [Clostridiisalibacter paucivorans]|uniref:MBL fold metallo-hydrolase n=1 Tax=Clostridiisalibacter paucivorans TaxID=408753 RepID=UPI000479ECBE|nr:MBL fold metallo-hydrolase [Clostridiisalibacter paucivorans]
MEKILSNLYRIEVPLPNNPLKVLNSYVILGTDRNLIIDTGFNRKECKNAIEEGLNKLKIDLNNTDFFITHLHADHSGLVTQLATENSKIYCSKYDGNIINLSTGNTQWSDYRKFAQTTGFSEDELEILATKHPGFKYNTSEKIDFCYIEDGDIIDIGEYSFRCLHTPGHTKGHMCLYEKSKKILISGDHILGDITPNISLWSDEYNPLGNYINSLDMVYDMDIDIVLPGHRSILKDHRKRIDELKGHHRQRLDEVIDILEDKEMIGYEVASNMHWDMTYENFEEFPAPQKWFAVGEAIAHLKYLEEKGDINRKIVDGNIVYFI